MALVITLKKGDSFLVSGKPYKVEDVRPGHKFVLERNGKRWLITDTMATEVEPNVFIASGKSPWTSDARVSIEAPKEIKLEQSKKVANAGVS